MPAVRRVETVHFPRPLLPSEGGVSCAEVGAGPTAPAVTAWGRASWRWRWDPPRENLADRSKPHSPTCRQGAKLHDASATESGREHASS